MPEVKIRKAVKGDLDGLGRMGAGMVQYHHAFDTKRFILPPNVDEGYAWWLEREMKNEKAVVLVAEGDGGRLAGYAYGTLEETNWSLLLAAHAGLHDVWVEESVRGAGIGRQLTLAMLDAFHSLGANQVVLMTAIQNEASQKLFASLGFRTTMVEWTKEL